MALTVHALTGTSAHVGGRAAAPAQRSVPLVSALRQEMAATRTRAHAPGHVGGKAASLDVRRLLGAQVMQADVWLATGRLHQVRRQAEELAALAWGARSAWLLSSGSSGGNLAWCLATLSEGQEVIVARDVHTSVLTGLIVSGARPRWVSPRVHPQLGLPLGVEPADLQAALERHPATRAVILSSPGYSGTCTDVGACVAVAGHHQAQVFVDQAWGAHFAFHPTLPGDAIAAGAAGAVVSLHKTGSALSSGALLLAGVGADVDRLQTAVTATQTTSPLLPVLASIDAARRDLAVSGRARLAGVIAAATWLAEQLDLIPGLHVAGPPELGLDPALVDPCKVIVDVAGLGYTGWEIETLLRDGHTAVEGADARRVCLLLGIEPATARATAAQVLQDLRDIARLLSPPFWPGPGAKSAAGPRAGSGLVSWLEPDPPTAAAGAWDLLAELPEQVLTPRQAFQASSRSVPFEQAVGHVAAEAVVPYPPGIPLIMPGERVTSPVIDVLRRVCRSGGHLHGCSDPTAATLRVVVPP